MPLRAAPRRQAFPARAGMNRPQGVSVMASSAFPARAEMNRPSLNSFSRHSAFPARAGIDPPPGKITIAPGRRSPHARG